MVSPEWLARIRQKNQEQFGMAGLGGESSGLGYVPSQDIVNAINRERGIRTKSIHAGRFERTDPTLPTEGSVESIAKAVGAPQQLPIPAGPSRAVVYMGGAVAVGLVDLIAFMTLRRS